MASSRSHHPDKVGPSTGNRAETLIGTFLITAFACFLLLIVADTRDNGTLTMIGRVLYWAAGAGIAVTIVITRTALRCHTSGFDWIFAAVWIVLTIMAWFNGHL